MPKTPQNPPTIRNVEFVAFPNVQVLDITGPLEVFETANMWASSMGRPAPYDTRVVSQSSPVRSWAGLELITHPLSHADRPIDTLIVAGGIGVHSAAEGRA